MNHKWKEMRHNYKILFTLMSLFLFSDETHGDLSDTVKQHRFTELATELVGTKDQ